MAAAALVAAKAASAPPAPLPSPAPPIAKSKVSIAPSLRASLAGKRKVDVQKAAALFRTDAAGSVLKFKTREYRLLDASANAAGKLSKNQISLPVKLASAKDGIAAWVPGTMPTFAALRADHRSDQSAIRDQGPRGTCSAFAATAGLESIVKRRHEVAAPTSVGGMKAGAAIPQIFVHDFSENHAFNRALEIRDQTCSVTSGVATWATTDAVLGGLCSENAFAYTSTCPSAGVPSACASANKAKINEVFSMGTAAHPVPDVPNDNAHRADNVALLESFLRDGSDIIYAIDVAGSDWGDVATGVVDVTMDANGDPAEPRGAHAMLMVGFDRPGKYFIFKNSWGADFGRDGYVYISYDYIQTYAWYGFAVLN